VELWSVDAPGVLTAVSTPCGDRELPAVEVSSCVTMVEDRLGRYRLLRRIAAGGMGEIFLAALDGPAGFSKPVVLKRILSHLAMDDRFVELFLNEARLAAKLSHPNVVQIFELGHEDDTYFIVMEHIDGLDLMALATRAFGSGGVPVGMAALICGQALKGLEYAHQLKDESGAPLRLVHRDVSMENILISTSGGVKLCDFGIAKAASTVALTRPGAWRGKIEYAAPEQIRAEELDGRVDVYAMGVVLGELLSGRPLFAGATRIEVSQRVLRGEMTLGAGIAPRLVAVVRRAMAVRREDRFETAAQMRLALDAAVAELGSTSTDDELAAFVRKTLEGIPVAGPGRSPTEALGVRTPATEVDDVSSRLPTVLATPGTMAVMRAADVAPAAAAPVAAARWRRPPRAASIAAVLTGAVFAVSVFGLVVAWRARETVALRVDVIAKLPDDAPPVRPVVAEQPEPVEPAAAAVEPPPSSELRPEPRASPHSAPPAVRHVRHEEPQLGKVIFRISPWADVSVDGRELGVTPMSPVDLPSGDHLFTLANSALHTKKSLRVVVPPGGRSVVLKADMFE
jgi:hypothetical protein